MLRAGETRRVVGERCSCELVGGKPLGDLLPALDARARIRFAERPEVPGSAIVGIGGDGTRGECSP